MKTKDTQLLREFVREVLVEDDTGGAGYGGAYGGSGMSGMGYMNYGGSLKSIFVQPFVDAGKIIKASTSKALLRIKTLAKVSIETILTTMIPFLKSNYTQIFKTEQEQLQKLKEKYRDAFKGVDAAFTKDVMVLSFMVSPTAFITAKLAMKAPREVASMLEVLTVGNEGVTKYFDDLKKRLDTIQKDLQDDVSNYKIGQDGKFIPKNQRGPYLTQKKKNLLSKAGLMSGFKRPGSTVSEAEAPPAQMTAQQKMGQEVAEALKNPEVQKALAESRYVQGMQADANMLVQNLQKNLIDSASRVLSAQSLDDIQRVLGTSVQMPNVEQLTPEDQEAAKAAVLTQVKAAAKDFYVQSLKTDIEGLQHDGVDPNNLYIRALNDTVSKLAAF